MTLLMIGCRLCATGSVPALAGNEKHFAPCVLRFSLR